jgi:hypothetical protein
LLISHHTVLFYMGGFAPYRQMLADVARADYAGFFQHRPDHAFSAGWIGWVRTQV